MTSTRSSARGWRSISSLAALLASLLAPVAATGQTSTKVLFDVKEQWKYFADVAGTADNWTALDFDDSAWQGAVPPFGYGEAALAFSVNLSAMQNTFLTAYFRKKFTVDDALLVTRLVFTCQYDDGVVIHLNGVEVGRANMPAGPPTINSAAPADHEYTAGALNLIFNANALKAVKTGENVLSVELHNTSLASSDLVFALARLTATLTAPPTVEFSRGIDCDGAAGLDIGDALYLLRWKLIGLYAEPGCIKSCDMNDDGLVDMADAVYELAYLFAGGPAIPAPYPAKGADPTDDPLTCITGQP